MLVRWLGVTLRVGSGLEPADLFEALKAHAAPFEYGKAERIVTVDKIGAYHVALFLTVRDHRKFMAMTEEGGKITVKPEEVSSNSQMVDFNFLGVHDTTGRGLYQHYRGSLGIGTLGGLLKREHRRLVNVKRGEVVESLGGNSKKAWKAARSLIDGAFGLDQIISEDDLPTLIERLDELKALSVDLVTVTDIPKNFQGLSDKVQTTRFRMRFAPGVTGLSLKKRILLALEQEKPKSGRLEGTEDGHARSFDIINNPPTIFGEHDFDEHATGFNADSFAEAPMLQKMLKEMRKNPSMFERLDEA